jgi:hypothetical protein
MFPSSNSVMYTISWIWYVCILYMLVGGAITILKNMKVNVIEKKKCLKPPTRYVHILVYTMHLSIFMYLYLCIVYFICFILYVYKNSSRFHHVWRLLHDVLPARPGSGSTAIAGENKSSSIAQLVPTALGDVHQWAWCVENWAVFHSSCSWNIGLLPRSLDLPPGFQRFLWGNDHMNH